MRQTMQAWVKGIGPLAQLIAPVREDGAVRSIGVQAYGKWFSYYWYYGKENLPEVTNLPSDVPARGPSDPTYNEWRGGRGSALGPQPAWLWRWTLDELTTRLSRLLEGQELPVPEGSLAQEILWQEALAVTGRPASYQDPIPLAEIENRMREFNDNTSYKGWLSEGPSVHIGKFRKKLEDLYRTGQTEIIAPWPGPDKSTGSSPWERYTPDQEMTRTKAVFEGALQAYQQIVSTWFPKLASRMQLAALLPARIVVILGRTKDGKPTRDWYFEPLARGTQSVAAVHFKQGGLQESDMSLLKKLKNQIQIFRPEMTTWGVPIVHYQLSTELFGLTPATELVYRWLQDDLERISWIK